MSHAAIAIPGLDRVSGAERQAMLLAKGMRRRGWRVTMIALSGTGGEAASELRDAGVGFITLEMRKGLADPRGWLRLNRWLWREKPDVLHAHLPHAAWIARWSRLAAPVPVVIDTLHSSSTGKLGRRLGYRWSRWLPDRVTAVSEAAAEAHRAAGMVCESRLSVLANGIDGIAWRPDILARNAARRELGIGDEFLWLAMGRLEPVKDYPTLLQAMALARQTARLVILGAGPLRGELQQMASELGLDGRATFLGFEPDARRWMQAADGFVHSSRYEGLPMVLLEAGACELPVVATDVPGTREAIVNGTTGWLTEAGDPAKLAAAMERMMNTPAAERRAMGEQARSEVQRRFGMDAILDRWEQMYFDLLERSRAHPRIHLLAWEYLRRHSAIPA
jgi:glycosyltransferase involved in cell wall biosynthesis